MYGQIRLVALIASLSCTTISTAQAADSGTPSVTPYRPSVSTPAALSAPGWIEAELGGLSARDGDSMHMDSIPYTFKLAFSPDWGVRLGGNAYTNAIDQTGERVGGVGDTSIVLKHRFTSNGTAALGAEFGVSFPTAKTGLGSGSTDYSVNGIYSVDSGDYHTDINLVLTRLGVVEPGQGDIQMGWAAALSRQFRHGFSAVGELSGSKQNGAENTSQLLVAASYSAMARESIDLGISHGLNRNTPRWSVFAGVTFLVRQLY